MTRARKLGFSATLVGLALFLGGPTPGSVGGCSDDAQFAEPGWFCSKKDEWECLRAEQRCMRDGMPDCVETRNLCISEINCAGFNWPVNCEPLPSKMRAQACIDQLMIIGNIDVPIGDIPECDLCP